MSSGFSCRSKAHRPYWVVVQRNYNTSAFNGYKPTYSEYSLVRCELGGCRAAWRTKAAYVQMLPDARKLSPLREAAVDLPESCSRCEEPGRTKCRVCRQSLCGPCFTDHHHEGYGTPAT